ncbi:MAG: Crp/Fnr family transcriptional regulator [Miltoncostaeaceae bacterium]
MTGPEQWRTMEVFAGLADEALAESVLDLPSAEVGAGQEYAVAAGGAACCLVARGRLALTVFAEENRERTIGILEQGDVLVRPLAGWAATGPRVRCFAIDDAVLGLVDDARIERWMEHPALARSLFAVMAQQIAERELAVAIALEPRVERRLLLKLRQLAGRWGRVTPDGVRLDLRLTHQELANMVGSARESVTIALGRLAESGEIEVRNRTLLIRHEVPAPGADEGRTTPV